MGLETATRNPPLDCFEPTLDLACAQVSSKGHLRHMEGIVEWNLAGHHSERSDTCLICRVSKMGLWFFDTLTEEILHQISYVSKIL